MIKDFMDSLLKEINGDDVKEALSNIFDETIHNVFAGKVPLVRSFTVNSLANALREIFLPTNESLSFGRL